MVRVAARRGDQDALLGLRSICTCFWMLARYCNALKRVSDRASEAGSCRMPPRPAAAGGPCGSAGRGSCTCFLAEPFPLTGGLPYVCSSIITHSRSFNWLQPSQAGPTPALAPSGVCPSCALELLHAQLRQEQVHCAHGHPLCSGWPWRPAPARRSLRPPASGPAPCSQTGCPAQCMSAAQGPPNLFVH